MGPPSSDQWGRQPSPGFAPGSVGMPPPLPLSLRSLTTSLGPRAARPGSESQLARATTRLELLLLLPAAGGSDDNPHHTHSLTVLACCDLPVTFKPVTPSILSSSGFPPACAAIKIHLIVPFLEENRPLLLLLRLAFPTPAKLRQASTTRSYAPHRVAK